jgi:hypothetical protein
MSNAFVDIKVSRSAKKSDPDNIMKAEAKYIVGEYIVFKINQNNCHQVKDKAHYAEYLHSSNIDNALF